MNRRKVKVGDLIETEGGCFYLVLEKCEEENFVNSLWHIKVNKIDKHQIKLNHIIYKTDTIVCNKGNSNE